MNITPTFDEPVLRSEALRPSYKAVTLIVLVVAVCVAAVGAYVRLMNAGLSCPDWPACYGSWMPSRAAPGTWLEMAHRYFVACLALGVVGVASLGFMVNYGRSLLWSSALLVVLVVQILLGMLTVTRALMPVVVTSHLLGGFALIGLLAAALYDRGHPIHNFWLWALLAFYAQAALGAWTSATGAYAACGEFPKCNGAWWPALDWGRAFNPEQAYGFASRSGIALATVQWVHRLGALVLAMIVLYGALRERWQPIALSATLVLGVQLLLGMANVLLARPLATGVLHNTCAALLLIILVRLALQSRAI